MSWIDWFFLVLVLSCVMQGALKGVLSQAFMLLRMVLAMIIALVVHVVWIPPSFIENQSLLSPASLYAISFGILYFVAWIVLFVLFFVIRSVFPSDKNLDVGQRLGGAIIAFFRGLAMVLLLVLFIDYTPLMRSNLWQNSEFRTYLEPIAQEVRTGFTVADEIARRNIEKWLDTSNEISQSTSSTF